MSENRIVSVSDIAYGIKNVIDRQVQLDDLWIQGEISNLTKHSNGNFYFSLKDKKARISCVIFSRDCRKLLFNLVEDMKVLVKARANYYLGNGQVQLIVTQIKPDGIGELALKFQQLKEKLYKEGYFNDSHKTKRPDCIGRIAIISSKDGDGTRDVVSKVRQRWPLMDMKLFPCYVQGPRSAESMIIQLKKVDELDYDAILLVRGGGSYEDLFSYNDEDLIKTIYNCKTYIVDGVGHREDVTLCDYVCDASTITPTAAAEWVTNDYKEVLVRLHNKKSQLIHGIQSILVKNKKELYTYQSNPYLQDPMTWLTEWKLRVDNYTQFFVNYHEILLHRVDEIDAKRQKMIHAVLKITSRCNQDLKSKESEMQFVLKTKKEENAYQYSTKKADLINAIHTYYKNQSLQLYRYISLLDAYSPLKTMERGFSCSFTDEGIIKSINDIKIGDTIHTVVLDGIIDSKITDKKEVEWKQKR